MASSTEESGGLVCSSLEVIVGRNIAPIEADDMNDQTWPFLLQTIEEYFPRRIEMMPLQQEAANYALS
ncbi:hypothetical protein IHE45_14G104100 [Dioscorea alata]|uniref:Uncharacterized protein n=1 Tax=Dioscorea alata TaxID=55571 RepID=A0ACB7UU66_DIOAL|nr:hypothetical protein IHE45_14G104100 [Dioscorea alata]